MAWPISFNNAIDRAVSTGSRSETGIELSNFSIIIVRLFPSEGEEKMCHILHQPVGGIDYTSEIMSVEFVA